MSVRGEMERDVSALSAQRAGLVIHSLFWPRATGIRMCNASWYHYNAD